MSDTRNGHSSHKRADQPNIFQWLLGVGAFLVFLLIFYAVFRVLGGANFSAFQGVGNDIIWFLIVVFVVIVAAGAAWIVSYFLSMAVANWRNQRPPIDDSIPLGPMSVIEQPDHPRLPPGDIVDSD